MRAATADSTTTAAQAVKGHHRQWTWTVLVAMFPASASAVETRTTTRGEGNRLRGRRAGLTKPSSCLQPASECEETPINLTSRHRPTRGVAAPPHPPPCSPPPPPPPPPHPPPLSS